MPDEFLTYKDTRQLLAALVGDRVQLTIGIAGRVILFQTHGQLRVAVDADVDGDAYAIYGGQENSHAPILVLSEEGFAPGIAPWSGAVGWNMAGVDVLVTRHESV